MKQRIKLMEIHEGNVVASIPKLKPLGEKSGYEVWKSPVFYNPVMKLNRDLSVMAVQVFQRRHALSLAACEPLAGSGIRGIRWAKEVDGIERIVLNDANPHAYRLASKNVAANRVAKKIKVHNSDANFLLQQFASKTERFDVIDLDPFGSPMPFLNSCMAATKRLSLLGITATDTAPLCGVKAEACIRKYGAKPLRTSYSHETAARILIGAAARIASIFEFGVKPLLTHSTDHYIRSYLELKMSVKHANATQRSLGYLYHCRQCLNRGLTTNLTLPGEHCTNCDSKVELGGPLWTTALQDRSFCEDVQIEALKRYPKENTRLLNLIRLLVEESEAPPLYHDLDEICDRIGTPNPSFKALFAELTSRGFIVSRTHFKPKALRSNAPIGEIEKAIRNLTAQSD